MNAIRNHCLDRVIERDIDLLLLEEVHCNTNFAGWLRDRSEIGGNCTFDNAWNSLATADGESDLIAIYNEGKLTRQRPQDEPVHIALMIENKIDAAFQPNQAERYRKRGQAGIEAGHWSKYVTILFAPKQYIKNMTGEHVFDLAISYEEAAKELNSYSDPRSLWKAEVLRQAAKGKMAHSRPIVPDEHVTELMNTLHKRIAAKGFGLTLPSERPWNVSSASWYLFPKPSLPPGTTLDHRTSEGIVCLNVNRSSASDVAKALTHALPEGAMIAQRGKATIILFKVEPLDLTSTVEDQYISYWESLRKALELRNWAAEYRDEFASIPRQK